jgi:hypothetical protein
MHAFQPLPGSSISVFADQGRRSSLPGYAPSFAAPAAPVPTDPALLLAEAMEAGRVEAHAEGYAAGHAAAMAEVQRAEDAVIAAALTAVPAALARLSDIAGSAARAEALALGGLLLGAFDAALPAEAARATPEAAARLAARLTPLLDQEIAVTLRVAPALAEAVAAKIADPRLTVAADERLPPGDLRAEWRGGHAVFDLAARRAAIRSALAEAGLALESDP